MTLPSTVTLAAACIYSLSGLANFFIFVLIRPNLFTEGGATRRGFKLSGKNETTCFRKKEDAAQDK
jgi:hypothetical protein